MPARRCGTGKDLTLAVDAHDAPNAVERWNVEADPARAVTTRAANVTGQPDCDEDLQDRLDRFIARDSVTVDQDREPGAHFFTIPSTGGATSSARIAAPRARISTPRARA